MRSKEREIMEQNNNKKSETSPYSEKAQVQSFFVF